MNKQIKSENYKSEPRTVTQNDAVRWYKNKEAEYVSLFCSSKSKKLAKKEKGKKKRKKEKEEKKREKEKL